MKDWILIIATLVGIVGIILFGVSQPYFEAKNFDQCTGGNASYWTALFTQLRIEECKR